MYLVQVDHAYGQKRLLKQSVEILKGGGTGHSPTSVDDARHGVEGPHELFKRRGGFTRARTTHSGGNRAMKSLGLEKKKKKKKQKSSKSNRGARGSQLVALHLLAQKRERRTKERKKESSSSSNLNNPRSQPANDIFLDTTEQGHGPLRPPKGRVQHHHHRLIRFQSRPPPPPHLAAAAAVQQSSKV